LFNFVGFFCQHISHHSAENKIDSKGAESLAEALKSNTTLTQLDLEGE
jgi:hypothetical protein